MTKPEHFAVLAVLGLDAMIVDETDTQLKDKVGSAAYFVGMSTSTRAGRR